MQENTVVQETTSANQGQISGQNVVRVVEKTETAETKRMKEHFLSLIHISEPTRLGMISYAVFCLKKKK